jgi:hypothetical protein
LQVPQFLDSLEQTGISSWLRESQSIFGFYFILTFHTIGLSMVVGPNAIIDLRLLGFAKDIPLAPMKRWFLLMWSGLVLNATTGVFLVLAYPTKAFTNFDFYAKLILIGFAVWTMARIEKQVFSDPNLTQEDMVARGKRLAIWSLVLWVAVITAGRLLAYTCLYLVYGAAC